MKDKDIFLLAHICSNSVKTIMSTCERIDIRKRTKEITDIEFGKKTSNAAVLKLYTETRTTLKSLHQRAMCR
tara:strand:- start:302 stop:517 length:216 start_codon:yes stop_codon:yes gene_type:complete